MSNNGIVYGLTGERSRGSLEDYHRKPKPLMLNKTKHAIDVSGLKKIEQRTNLKFDGEDYASKFTIGFEVEKNEMSRSAIKEYELFCGFEKDGSCGYFASSSYGYEAVTHILPLLPAGKWRTKVFDMMHKAEKIIDDRFSPSNGRCGGHITIGVDGLSGEDLRVLIAENSGIVLALFRHRLNNLYCGSNRRIQNRYDSTFNSSLSGGSYYYPSQRHYKYQVALVKDDCLEFRLPSRFESVKQMMRRYELMYELVDFSVNKPNGSHDAFLKRIKPIILSMYNGDENKVQIVFTLAKHFRAFILKGKISPEIERYL